MSVLNRTTGRLAKAAAVGALGAAVVLGASACGAGKISQTNNQLAAVNGAGGSVTLSPDAGSDLANGTIALRNVQIVYPTDKADKTFKDGGPFDVSFAISNDSNTRSVKLVDVVGPEGSNIVLTPPSTSKKDGDKTADPSTIGPNGVLLAGTPANVNTSIAQEADIYRFTATLTNAGSSVASGVTVPLTFKFEVYDLSGKKVEDKQVVIDTPVDNGTLEHRLDVVRDPQAHNEGSEEGH
ncbi:copper-binding protein [Gordonia sp. PDNC005]|uniref:copper-binding protein n=1 Tax=unclassified Gordonia (in: high G+C Gram-positive bacteria) TaxID=2657482 RepID=UPI0019668450|nr:copper-binding protein [Gordonia sp. PDNC005]QRY61804.1 copper-binding protein [Gordonia sp. PDNC005]